MSAKLHFREHINNQLVLFPQRIDEDIAPNDPVRLVNAVVDSLDLERFNKLYRERGRSPYHPRMMLKVIIYAYMNNIYSCRRIEQSLRRDIHYIWLAGYEKPDFVTINRFRLRVKDEIENGFPLLPKGCYIKLEKQAQKYILDNINQAIGDKRAIIKRLANFTEDSGKTLTLANFLDYYNLDISAIYRTNNSFARLCVQAEVKPDFSEDIEEVITKALPRLSYIDSHRLIELVIDYLPKIGNYSISDFDGVQQRMWQMLQFTIWQKSYEDCGFSDLLEGFRKIAKSPVMLGEILELMYYKYDKIDFIDEPVQVDYDCPLDVHCSYTRDQILVALDFMKPDTVREGVKYLDNKKTDLLFVTLNKSDKDYSPTTMYNDYSINNEFFHWQSQSTITPESKTGQRYIHHRDIGSSVMIFVREYKRNKLGAAPYTFLGLADYVKSEGSKPMNVVWKLRKPIPAKYLKKTNQLTVG